MKEKPLPNPGRIKWPKFPKRKREYGKEPKEPVRMKSVISSFGIAGIDLKLKEYNIRKIWVEAVGTGIAKRTAPLMLIDSTLHCAVSSSPWITELNFQKEAIIKKINSALGETAVTKIIFKPGRVEKPPETAAGSDKQENSTVEPLKTKEFTEKQGRFIDSTVKDINDPGLQEVIKRAMKRAIGTREEE